MSIFKRLFEKLISFLDEPPDALADLDDTQGKHIVRIMVGNKEMVLLLTDLEFVRAAERARVQLNEMSIEEDEGVYRNESED